MDLFLELEVVYLVIGAFLLSVTAFVTTRDFMPKVAFKRGMLMVGGFVAILISIHYSMTTTRMEGVKKLFRGNQLLFIRIFKIN